MMKRVIHKARNFKEAERWDISQQIKMSPGERQQIVKELKRRFYGSRLTDVRRKKR